MQYASRRMQREKRLKPVRANKGIEVQYRRKLDRLIEEMHNSTIYWITAAWRHADPATVQLAHDETPVSILRRTVSEMRKRWEKQFEQASKDLADHFAKDIMDRSDAALKRALREGGFTVKFRLTAPMKDVLDATVQGNVALIKSIPAKYLQQIESAVMQSVQAGRDLRSLTKTLENEYGVTRRRASLIARDQNAKATASMNRVRQLDLGIEKAIWRHSHAGEVPRPTHVKMDGKKFDVAEGMYDSDEGRNIQPGELINCRCYSVPIIPGF